MFGLVIHHHLVKELSLPETVPGGMAAYRQTLAVPGKPKKQIFIQQITRGKPEKTAVYKG